MPKLFQTRLTPRFSDADPAGVVFFARIISLGHDVIEDFVTQGLGLTWQEWFGNESFAAPFRHVDAEFLSPLWPGQVTEATLAVSHVGESSFSTQIEFFQGAVIKARLKFTEVSVGLKNKSKQPIPPLIKNKLLGFYR